MTLYNLACIFALADEPAEALASLEAAVSLGFAHWSWLEQDSNLDPLREHPRFRALLDRRRCGEGGTHASFQGPSNDPR